MYLIRFFLLLSGISLAAAAIGQSYVPHTGKSAMVVKETVPLRALAFPLDRVILLEGPFKDAMEADVAWLASLEPDRLLADFRNHAGLKAKAERYGGWESSGLAGHSLGHYLSACAMHYAVSRDERFLRKVNYIVEELAECQALRNGYLGAIPKEDSVWAEVKKGNITSRGFDLNGAWSPWYTVHKIMAGLLDAKLYCGNSKALEVQVKFADWTERLLKDLPDSLIQKMLLCEYGGMNESLVNTYALTRQKKYLDLSYQFHDRKILDSLALQHDILPGKHSNTQIPKLIGTLRRYQLTGREEDRRSADFFWQTVVNSHTYAPGGNSNYEYFGPAGKLSETLTDNTMETCNTYNMLKLTRHLYALNPQASYFDFYERGLYNHILASQHDGDGMMCYFVPLRMGTRKRFSHPTHTFTCCVGSGMENHVKFGEAIYATDAASNLSVNLYIPSELDFREQGARITLQTALPESDQVTLSLQLRKARKFTIKLRKPYWVKDKLAVKVNGREVSTAVDDAGYLLVNRTWKDGDLITLTLPMHLHAISMPDNPGRQAYFYGPVTLAGVFGNTEPDPVTGIPVVVTTNADPGSWMQREPGDSLVFHTRGVGRPQEIRFRPFHEINDEYYSVYFDLFNPGEWKTRQQEYEAEKRRQRKMDSLTIDALRIGEMQPERDHELTGEDSFTGEAHGKKWRATRGGSLFFTMKVSAVGANELLLSYWGMDNRNRTFDIFVDGSLVATEDINKYKASKFYDITYPIPAALTSGKEKVRIELRAKPRNNVGPLYGTIRMMRKEALPAQ